MTPTEHVPSHAIIPQSYAFLFCKPHDQATAGRTAFAAVVFLATFFFVSGVSAWGEKINLIDVNSQVDISVGEEDDGTVGVTRWEVDGVDHLARQWFWYRVGDDGPEVPLDSETVLVMTTDGDFDDGIERAVMRFVMDGLFVVDVDLTVSGGAVGSGKSDIAEVITITNTGLEPLDLHFFQYSNFDLGASPGDDVVEILGGNGDSLSGNTVEQSDSLFNATETVVTPRPSSSEVAAFAATETKLGDSDADNLDGSAGPFGPADVTWAFQWDAVIPVGDTLQISKDKQISAVPEPSSLVLLALGLIGLGGYALRRRRRH